MPKLIDGTSAKALASESRKRIDATNRLAEKQRLNNIAIQRARPKPTPSNNKDLNAFLKRIFLNATEGKKILNISFEEDVDLYFYELEEYGYCIASRKLGIDFRVYEAFEMLEASISNRLIKAYSDEIDFSIFAKTIIFPSQKEIDEFVEQVGAQLGSGILEDSIRCVYESAVELKKNLEEFPVRGESNPHKQKNSEPEEADSWAISWAAPLESNRHSKSFYFAGNMAWLCSNEGQQLLGAINSEIEVATHFGKNYLEFFLFVSTGVICFQDLRLGSTKLGSDHLKILYSLLGYKFSFKRSKTPPATFRLSW